MTRAGGLLVAALAGLLVCGCGPAGGPYGGRETSGSASPSGGWWSPDPSRTPPGGDIGGAFPLLRGIGTVLDDGDGPELCLGPIMTSLPPRCGGPRLIGWDWSAVDSVRRGGTRWTGAEYVVTGTFDVATRTLTVTQPPVSSREYDGPRPPRSYDEDERLGTACPEPPGGWQPVDPARTTQRALTRVARVARTLDGFADLWWDQSVNPAYDDPEADPGTMNDPAKLVVNVRVVGDVATAERRLREVWGGALCVTQAERTEAELRRIQAAVVRTPGLVTASSGRDIVEVDVEYDDGSLQRRFDERYGPGVVRVYSALRPVTDGAEAPSRS